MRIAASSSMQKLRGQAPKRTYPHTEGFLGEMMVKGSTDLGEDSYFGWLLFDAWIIIIQCSAQALADFGDTMKQVADFKDALVGLTELFKEFLNILDLF